MSRRSKLDRFSDNQSSWNVIESGKPLFESIKGNWQDFFKNDHPIVVELACGRGEYTIGLAEKFPEKNFIGVDLKGDRIWKGSQYALSNNLTNVVFLRANIGRLCDFFKHDEVDEIWLTFPDPRPKDRDEKHRLTNTYFLGMYKNILKPEGWFKFKTDNTFLFEYTLHTLDGLPTKDQIQTYDLYQSDYSEDHFGLKTKYEKIWTEKGEKVKYLKFRFS